MARVIRFKNGVRHVKQVKNLGWFFRHAQKVVIERFDLYQSNQGWEMFVEFADGATFQTHYADLNVFKHFMSRRPSLRGYEVKIHREDGVETLRLGR